MNISVGVGFSGKCGTALAIAALTLATVLFWHDTLPIRYANSDDVDYGRFTIHGTWPEFVAGFSQMQGRFYVRSYALIEQAHFGVKAPWAFAAIRTGLVTLLVAGASILVGQLSSNARAGLLAAVMIAGALQVSPTYYALLSYAPVQLGGCLILASLICFDRFLQTGILRWRAFAAGFFGLGLLFHEVFFAGVALFPAILFLRVGRSCLRRWRDCLAFGIIAGAYLLVYYFFRRVSAPLHTYDGTALNLNPRESLLALTRFTLGVTPGLELIFDRRADGGVPLRNSMQILSDLSGVANPIRIGFAAFIGAATGTLVWEVRTYSFPRVTTAAGWLAAAAAFLVNLPIALTPKYQIWAHQREFPYIYSIFSWLALAAGLALMLSVVVRQCAKRTLAATAISVGTGLVFGLVCFGVQASNQRVLAELAVRYNAR